MRSGIFFFFQGLSNVWYYLKDEVIAFSSEAMLLSSISALCGLKFLSGR